MSAAKAARSGKNNESRGRNSAHGGSTANHGKDLGHKNEKVGEVVSTKMAKTIVVEVTRRVAHPVYKRIVSKRKKFYAHDEAQSAKSRRRGPDRGMPSFEPPEALGA